MISPEVFEAMRPFLNASFGNPSSAYRIGREARSAVTAARERVAELVGAAMSSEITFTSCGTESDNWAIGGALFSRPAKKHIVTTRVEHEAVRNLCLELERRGYDITWLEVDQQGRIDLEDLKFSLRADTAIVSIMMANNETGIVFPVNEAAEIVRERSDAFFHVDAVNAAGKIPISVKDSNIDLLSISGHKFHGPKGIGALYIRSGIEISPSMIGGRQEQGRRAGTEAVHQIAGLGAAATVASDLSEMNRVRSLRNRLEETILTTVPETYLNGTVPQDLRLPNTSNIAFENLNGEVILARLDDAGICVSTGSACNSANKTVSPVLQAMEIPYSRAMGSIRFSLGRSNTEEEVQIALQKLSGIIEDLRRMSP